MWQMLTDTILPIAQPYGNWMTAACVLGVCAWLRCPTQRRGAFRWINIMIGLLALVVSYKLVLVTADLRPRPLLRVSLSVSCVPADIETREFAQGIDSHYQQVLADYVNRVTKPKHSYVLVVENCDTGPAHWFRAVVEVDTKCGRFALNHRFDRPIAAGERIEIAFASCYPGSRAELHEFTYGDDSRTYTLDVKTLRVNAPPVRSARRDGTLD